MCMLLRDGAMLEESYKEAAHSVAGVGSFVESSIGW